SQTFCPDGRLVAQFGPTGVEVRRRAGDKDLLWRSPGAARWARFTSDGRRLLTADLAAVHSWDALSGRQVGKPIPLDGGRDRREFAFGTGRVAPNADGKRIATLDDPRTVSVWEVETGQRVLGPLRNLDGYRHVFGPPESHGQIAHPRLTPNGQTLGFGIPSGGILAAWDVAS